MLKLFFIETIIFSKILFYNFFVHQILYSASAHSCFSVEFVADFEV